MDRIAFLISDLSMQQMVHTILDTYKEKLEQHHFIIDVEIIDFPNLVAQAHALVEKGTKVIITTSGAHQILTKAIGHIVKRLSNAVHCFYIMKSHQIKAKTVNMIFFCPVAHTVCHILPEHFPLACRIIAAARAVAEITVLIGSVIIIRHCL